MTLLIKNSNLKYHPLSKTQFLEIIETPGAGSTDQRVPDTRPEPEIFFNTRSIPDLFSKSSGISGIGYFRKRSFGENFFCSKLVRMLSPNIFFDKHSNSTNHIKFYQSTTLGPPIHGPQQLSIAFHEDRILYLSLTTNITGLRF